MERSSSSRSMQAGACRSLSCRAEIVSSPSAKTRRQTRRLSEAGAYSRKSKPYWRNIPSSRRESSISSRSSWPGGCLPTPAGSREAPTEAIPLLVQPDSHQRKELVGVDRLRYVVGGPRGDRLLAIALHCLRREGDDRQLLERLIAADDPHRLVAVHARHHDVHQDEVDLRMLPQELDAVLPVLGVEHLHAVGLEDARQ